MQYVIRNDCRHLCLQQADLKKIWKAAGKQTSGGSDIVRYINGYII